MASPHVVDATERNFRQEVIDQSGRAPVLVDFWAEWCGPCKTLGPALERLADEYAGRFRLVKVDVEKEKRLAATFRVQSVPTVAAVFHGQVIDQFVGALPAPELKRFIDDVLTRAGIEPPTADPPDDPAQAEQFWRKRLRKSPEDGEALLALCRLLVARGAVDEARTGFGKITASMPQYAAAQAALAMLGLMDRVTAAGGEAAARTRLAADPADLEAAFLVGCATAAKGRMAEALSGLVDIVGRARGDIREEARKAAALVLEAAGREDPEIEVLRRKLARLLF